ncbi:hypothetical protein TraAM80_05560, partial [Trypanosoma rangeli]
MVTRTHAHDGSNRSQAQAHADAGAHRHARRPAWQQPPPRKGTRSPHSQNQGPRNYTRKSPGDERRTAIAPSLVDGHSDSKMQRNWWSRSTGTSRADVKLGRKDPCVSTAPSNAPTPPASHTPRCSALRAVTRSCPATIQRIKVSQTSFVSSQLFKKTDTSQRPAIVWSAFSR